jgi:hypothetical protein
MVGGELMVEVLSLGKTFLKLTVLRLILPGGLVNFVAPI